MSRRDIACRGSELTSHFTLESQSVLEFDPMATNQAPVAQTVVDRRPRSAADEGSGQPVHRLVEAQAQAHPEQNALLFEDKTWTYGELNRRANQVAHRLRQLGVGPDDPVGVHVDRSPFLVSSLLGVLKAGGAYVALDPTLPSERLQFMIEDAGVEIVVVASMGNHRDWSAETFVDTTAPAVEQQPEDNPEVDLNDAHLAYLLYTSGTTGRPKGVMQSHRALRQHARVFSEEIAEVTGDRTFLFKSSYSFDLSISELFPPLVRGARVAVAGPEVRGVRRLVHAIQTHGVTDLFVTPTRLQLLMDRDDFYDCTSLQRVYSAGEALSGDVRDKFLDRFEASLYNLYGTTEMCCGQTGLNCADEENPSSVVSIGRPWSIYDAYVSDGDMQLTSKGTPGELIIGGAGEARGYQSRPRETALRFVPDPFSPHCGGRLYRTGDRARWTEEGHLEYLGREDRQLQVRGVRIERSELEAKLSEAEGIDFAAVRPVNERSGKADGLVGYVVPEDGRAPDTSVLREWIEAHFPKPAIPQHLCVLDEMPLLPSGKIDYSALPDPESVAPRRKDLVVPKTSTQRRLAAIWKKHLELDEVGIHEHFFQIGGHSLLAVRIQHEMAEQLGAEVSLETFLESPTIAALSDALDPLRGRRSEPIEHHEYGTEVPLSASQRRMWFLQKFNPDSVAYNVPAVIRLNSDVDVDAFRRTLIRLVERHEVLRTVFPERDGAPVQQIRPAPERISWTVDDLTTAEDPVGEARSLIQRWVRTPFDLTEETPLRLLMVKTSDDEWLFCPLFHHIAIDEWTFGVLLDDLQALYEAERAGGADGTPLLPPETERTAQWHHTHEVLHQGLSPDTAEDPTLNTTGWTNSYDGEPFSDAEMRDWLRARVERLRTLDLGRTLEIGSGTGMLLFRLAPHAEEYVGLDFSKSALDYVEAVSQRLEQDFSNVSLIHGRADEVGDLDGQFDTIILNSVLQYFPDYDYLDTVLHAAAEKLRIPGILYLGDVRDRRLAYAFHTSVQRAQAQAKTSRATLQKRAGRALTREDELLVSPQYLTQLANGLPGISGIDFTLPPAAHSTEMATFRYGAFLHARPDTAPVPDQVTNWHECRPELSALRARLEAYEGSLLVTGVPNARLQEALHFQDWLHRRSDEIPIANFARDNGTDVSAFDPDAFRRVGKAAGFRVTISPSNDPSGGTFDAVFEPQSTVGSPVRPLTPLSAEASSIPTPTPVPEPSFGGGAEGPSVSLWKTVLDQTTNGRTESLDRIDAGPGERPIQYADYALWQQDQLQGERYEEALAYWVEQLESVPECLDWPFDGLDRDREFGPAKTLELEIEGDLASALKACADRQGTTMSVVFLAALGMLLSRYTGQRDMAIGLPVTTRDRPELHRLVGMLLNTLPFPLHVDGALDFESFVERLGQQWRETMSRKWVPFEDIVEAVGAERLGRRLPLVDVMFTYVPAGRREDRLGTLGDVVTDPIEFEMPQALAPLFVIVTEQEKGYRVRFRYDVTRFKEASIRRMTGHFEQLLEAGIEAPDAPLSRLEMLSAEETQRLTNGWANGPRIDVPDVPVHRLFETKADTHPERAAIVSEEETWTYRTLNRRANRLAHRLREAGVGPGVPVGVSMDRSAHLIATLLGVLKAGGAYVALPPSLPTRRRQYMAQDAEVDLVVTDDPSRTELDVQAIDAGILRDDELPEDNPEVDVPSQALAYILYTSGTTGRPKGVMVSHAAVTDMTIVMKTHFPSGKSDTILLKTPYSFDVSVSEIFNPLTAGAKIVTTPSGAEKNPQVLSDRIQNTGVTVLRMTPTELANLLEVDGVENCDSIRRVFAAGAALTPAVRDRFHEVWDAELLNLWGPTEACVYGSWWPSKEDGMQSGTEGVPIGWPLSNVSLYCLDEALSPVPAQARGELYSAGPGLARGYHRKPRETAAAYCPNPHSDEKGARLYKTGDLVRWAEDGYLHFLGRKDSQIQLRGIRVELGEIESHLEAAPVVRNAAVRPVEGDDGRVESLIAYVVLKAGHALDPRTLRDHLGEHLPRSVLPGRYVEIETMPRTPSGKIDRQGLPEPETQDRPMEDISLTTDTERLIAAIWRDVLDLENVGRNANFFEVGGNSLAAVKVHRRLQRHFDREIDLVHLFEHTTVAQLADFIETLEPPAERPSDPQQERGRRRRTQLKRQRRERADRDEQ